ncbi:unnamed protein product [Colias eurytheme]|nr:unnamed protein product [Colias eurytheme]
MLNVVGLGSGHSTPRTTTLKRPANNDSTGDGEEVRASRRCFNRRKEPQSPAYFSLARSEIPGYFSPAQTYVSSPSPSPQQQLRATSSRSTYSEPPMQQQRGTISRSTYSESPMQQQRGARFISDYNKQ